MRYLVDISQRQAEKIQKYLDDGHYLSISQFIITAIENQFNLEDSQLPPGIIESVDVIKPPHTISNPLHFSKILEAYKISDMPNFYSVLPKPEFNQVVLSAQGIQEDKVWVWGQINKIFPVKIGLRILQKSLGNKQSIDLNDFLDAASKEAAEIGNIITDYEKRNNKIRNDKISAGLPLKGDEKSQSRYRFQFLAYQRKDNLLDGAMAILRFCNIERKNGKLQIGLTTGGANFSTAINPVLDNGDLDNALSNEEITCYLDHIRDNVKSEYAAIIWMLKKIDGGINERSALNTVLNKEFGQLWGASESVINTQRSGITARIFELGLIEKEKIGINVTYHISKSGLKFLSSLK